MNSFFIHNSNNSVNLYNYTGFGTLIETFPFTSVFSYPTVSITDARLVSLYTGTNIWELKFTVDEDVDSSAELMLRVDFDKLNP